MVNFFLQSCTFVSNLSFFTCVDPDPQKLLNTDPIWIRIWIHKSSCSGYRHGQEERKFMSWSRESREKKKVKNDQKLYENDE